VWAVFNLEISCKSKCVTPQGPTKQQSRRSPAKLQTSTLSPASRKTDSSISAISPLPPPSPLPQPEAPPPLLPPPPPSTVCSCCVAFRVLLLPPALLDPLRVPPPPLRASSSPTNTQPPSPPTACTWADRPSWISNEPPDDTSSPRSARRVDRTAGWSYSSDAGDRDWMTSASAVTCFFLVRWVEMDWLVGEDEGTCMGREPSRIVMCRHA
jgi:hypothetical protein